MVRLCRMKVWRPSHRSFMQSSKTTTMRANSSRVAWTCGRTEGVRHCDITAPHPPRPAHGRPHPTASPSEGGDGEWDCSSGVLPTWSHGAAASPKGDNQVVPSLDFKRGQRHRGTEGSAFTPRGGPGHGRWVGHCCSQGPLGPPPRASVLNPVVVSALPECPLSGWR